MLDFNCKHKIKSHGDVFYSAALVKMEYIIVIRSLQCEIVTFKTITTNSVYAGYKIKAF